MKVVGAGHRFGATHIGSVLDDAVAALCCCTSCMADHAIGERKQLRLALVDLGVIGRRDTRPGDTFESCQVTSLTVGGCR
jgi:hypothetical protein